MDAVLGAESAIFAFMLIAFLVWERLWLQPRRTFLTPDEQVERRWNIAGFLLCLSFVSLTRAAWFALWGQPNVSGAEAVTDLKDTLLVQSFSPARVVAALLLVDGGTYFIHRWLHASGFLWKAHAWHHSFTRFTWIAGFRSSLLQNVVWNLPGLILFSCGWLSWADWVCVLAVAIFFQFWLHSRSAYTSRRVEWVFATPGWHRLHHLRHPEGITGPLGTVNFAPFFTLFDRLCGTHCSPLKAEAHAGDRSFRFGDAKISGLRTRENLRALIGL